MADVKEFKRLWGMVVDLDKCTGCGACMIACQAENNVALTTDAGNRLRTMNWLYVFRLSNGKPYPEHELAYLPRPCMQCGRPSCVTVCPVVATDKNEEGGIVSQVYPRCIGCRYCMASCPYHARYFNWYDPDWPEGLDKVLNTNTSVRPRGVVEKCTFCHHRLNEARARARVEGRDPDALEQGEYVTACAAACPNGAIAFGDLRNAGHTVHALARSPHAFRLLERLHTEPQVYYISRRDWVRRQGDNYLKEEKPKGVA
jgi:molybdopterin-containing oxidoreductase family iron-sulfur binding subunit